MAAAFVTIAGQLAEQAAGSGGYCRPTSEHDVLHTDRPIQPFKASSGIPHVELFVGTAAHVFAEELASS
ncbi:MAG: hypothetical protein WCI05_03315 [Myxococcales bacterium]